jgi:hypothetical protein
MASLCPLFIILSLGAFESVRTHNCSLGRFCDQDALCQGFESLEALNDSLKYPLEYDLCDTYFYSTQTIVSIELAANYRIPALGNQLDLNSLFSQIKGSNVTTPLDFTFNLLFFKGLDLNMTIPEDNYRHLFDAWSDSINSMFFGFAPFELYFNGELLKMSSDGGQTCDETQLVEIFKQTNHNFFGLSSSLFLHQLRFTRKWCASVFRNLYLSLLLVEGQPIRFYSENSTLFNASNINCVIRSLELNQTIIENFNKEILHPQLYGRLQTLSVSGAIGKIQTDIFKDLVELSFFQLAIYNLRGFLHTNGIEWTRYLNFYKSTRNLSDLVKMNNSANSEMDDYISNSLVTIVIDNRRNDDLYPIEYFPFIGYEFPDADFCIFADFPHEKLVIMQLFNPLSECSCTILWVFKYLSLYVSYNSKGLYRLHSDSIKICFLNDTDLFESAYKACKIPDRIQMCKSLTKNKPDEYHDSFFEFYDLHNALKDVKAYYLRYTGAFFSCFALSTNLLVVVTLLNARKLSKSIIKVSPQLSQIKEPFFTYMLINSVLNSAYSLIFAYNYIFKCVPQPLEMNIKLTRDNCLQRDIWISTFGSVLKLMANYTFIQMSLNRYLLVGKDHPKRVVKLGQLSIRLGVLVSFVASCFLSIISIFQQYFFR